MIQFAKFNIELIINYINKKLLKKSKIFFKWEITIKTKMIL